MKDSVTAVARSGPAQAVIENQARLRAFRASGMLSPDADEELDRMARLACRVLEGSGAAISFVDEERELLRAEHDGPAFLQCADGIALAASLAERVVAERKPIVVPDTSKAADFARKDKAHRGAIGAFLGVPIRALEGEVLGAFYVVNDVPRLWEQSDIRTLSDFAKVIDAELVLRRTVANQDLILDEMTHRIKNLCSVVAGMVRLDRHHTETADELADRLRARIEALGAAHQLIVPVVTAGALKVATTCLFDVAMKLLKPYMLDDHVVLQGPNVKLGERAAVNLALALHEIATNAVKYGALSVPNGRVRLGWSQTLQGLCIEWLEDSVASGEINDAKQGFGSLLLDLSIRGNLDGEVVTERSEAAFSVRLNIPAHALAD